MKNSNFHHNPFIMAFFISRRIVQIMNSDHLFILRRFNKKKYQNSIKTRRAQAKMTRFRFLLYFVFLLGIKNGLASQPPSHHGAGGITEKRQDTTIQGDFYFGIQTIKYMFFFGDSYTTIRYDINSSPKPSLQAPIGVAYPGHGSGNGPSWPTELVYHFNYSNVISFNMAFGGATVDRYVVSPFLDLIECFREQVKKFRFRLGNSPNTPDWPYPWTSGDSLFFFWFGINDLWRSNGWTNGSSSALHDRILDSYFTGVTELYDSGARNLVFFTVPPLELTPELRGRTLAEQNSIRASVYQFNTKLKDKINDYKKIWKSATFFLVDAHALFHHFDVNASAYGFINKTGRCPHYVPFEAPDLGYNARTGWHNFEAKYDARCKYSVRRFFWLDAWHPTSRVQEAIASFAAMALFEYP
ncbi:hypothetical protein DFH27DRAFT_597106 [Peziza echinospora]|nr:hypothetical protein DFH27DRAFT_597106 [Peziza echinospora]